MFRFLMIAVALLVFSSSGTDARTLLTPSTRDFYVQMPPPYGSGDDANDCRLATPCATIQRAVQNVKQNYDTNCLQAWIRVYPGTYSGWEDYEAQTGCQPKGGGLTVISGITSGYFGSDCTDPSLVNIVSSPGVNAVSYDGGAKAIVICMTVSAPGASAIYSTNGAILEIGLLRFGTADKHINADVKGTIIATSTLDFVQGATFATYSNFDGYIHAVPGITMKFATGIGYAQQFAFAINGGKVDLPMNSITMVGNPTGQKCYASIAGLIATSGALSALPGTTPCGFYDGPTGKGVIY